MKFYAIRHRQTGNYLPMEWKGTSYWEGEAGKAPRLLSLRAAKSLITQWALGQHRNVIHYSDTPLGRDDWVEHEITPCGRSRSDLEIVEVTLTFAPTQLILL